MHRILIVDDEAVITMQLEERLSAMNYHVVGTASTGEEAVKLAAELNPDVILMDIVMPGSINGIQAAEKITANANVAIIFLTAYADDKFLRKAKNVAPFGYLIKPFQEKEIKAAIEIAIYKRQLDKKLQLSEERYRSVFNTAKEAILIVDTNEQIVTCNQAASEMFGYPAKEVLGTPIKQLVPAVDLLDRSDIDETAVADFLETEGLRRNGDTFPLQLSNSHWHTDEENYWTLIIRDITTQKAMEMALSDEKERLTVTLRSIGDAVITTTTNGEIVLMNQIAEQLTGWTESEAMGHPLNDVFRCRTRTQEPKIINPVAEVIKKRRPVKLNRNLTLIARDGTERIITDSCAPIRDHSSKIRGMVLVFSDITDQKKFESELLKASKLESIGILAGGIAHDFNNILTAIIGNLHLARLDLDSNSTSAALLSEVETATMRARELTRQLLTFSKGGVPIKKPSSLYELVRESAKFALIGSNVKLDIKNQPNLWPASIDSGQISQVVNNLVINADQAMPDGGTLTIDLANIPPQDMNNQPLKSGHYVRVRVTDTGIGIPYNLHEKIFDPYFSTKQKGNGLGLAIAYSIIKKHQGNISLTSTPGKGTCFELYLPAQPNDKIEPEIELTPPAQSQGRVLIMDDEKPILEIADKILSRLGYDVLQAPNGETVLEIYREAMQAKKPIDVVIMDLTIPGGMGGKETIKELLKIDPKVKAIVSSGYSNDPVMANHQKYGFSNYIPKPYRLEELANVLKATLDGEKNSQN